MSETITPEQAVKIAKWLGHFVKFGFGFKVPSNPSTETVDWYIEFLSSPKGEVAIRKKLKVDGKGVYEEMGLTVISWPDNTAEGENLITATLKMLEVT